MSDTTRRECYEKISTFMRQVILAYYQQHTGLLGDERSQRAIKESVDGLNGIFEILDGYEIEARPKGVTA